MAKSAQSVMLAIHGKRTDAADLKVPLLQYIRATYSDREADDAADDVSSVQQLRGDIAVAHAAGANSSLKENHLKYLRCLTSIETRFPISKEKGHAAVAFTWCDAFQPKKKATQHNVHYEKAAVVFNLASIVSQMALACDRSTADGLKNACQGFQEASGLFAWLRDHECNKIDAPRPTDMTTECVTLLERLMLAQAQECVFHKAVIDKKTPSLLARLAKQQHLMYLEVERGFATKTMEVYFDKSWLAHTQMKASVYDVEALMKQALSFRVEDKINFEIAALQEAFQRVQATKKIAKGISPEIKDSVDRLQEGIQYALTKAEKDNGTVYLQRVPPFADLPAVQGAQLAKATVPPGLDSGETELFSGLVPESAARALSKYTEMVDGATRVMLDRLATATDDARIKLKEMELPELLEALDARTTAALPDAVQHELEEVESVGGPTHLRDILAEIGQIREDVDRSLFQIQSELDGDAATDAEARAKFGETWRVPSAATVAKPYWDKVQVYRTSLQKAADSDKHVIARLTESEPTFADLRVETAITKMPRLQAPMVSVGPEDPVAVVGALRRNLQLLQTLASERAAMEDAVKDAKRSDNILPKLMATPAAGHDALFAAEMQRYSALRGDVDRNLEQQTRTMLDVERDCATFVSVFDVAGWRASCDGSATGMREAVKLFRELLNHLSEGLRFYIGTAEVVKKTLQETQDFVYTRGVQREEIKGDLERRKANAESDRLSVQMASANLHAPPAGTSVAYPAPPPPQHSVSPPPPPQQQQRYQPPPQQHPAGSPPQQQYQRVPSPPHHESLPPQQQHHQQSPPQAQAQAYYQQLPPSQAPQHPQHQQYAAAPQHPQPPHAQPPTYYPGYTPQQQAPSPPHQQHQYQQQQQYGAPSPAGQYGAPPPGYQQAPTYPQQGYQQPYPPQQQQYDLGPYRQ